MVRGWFDILSKDLEEPDILHIRLFFYQAQQICAQRVHAFTHALFCVLMEGQGQLSKWQLIYIVHSCQRRQRKGIKVTMR